MTSIIESIDIFKNETNYTGFEGYTFNTNTGPINIKISSDQYCCENWSTYTSIEDEKLLDLIGAEIINIYYADYYDYEIDNPEINTIEVVIEYKLNNIDDKIKIYLCNEHNGYYSHECIINWKIYINGVLNEESVIKSL
jgi:hypothetical protein